VIFDRRYEISCQTAIINYQLLIINCFGQDIHLSQFNASPQNLNPAQTGLFDGDWRFVGNHKIRVDLFFCAESFAFQTRSLRAIE